MKKRAIYIILFFLFLGYSVKATHNRAGEITFKQISALTYQITIRTFTYVFSDADRPSLFVDWDDNTISEVFRTPRARELTERVGDYQINIYEAQHTFPGPGIYEVIVQDPNRNYGVLNIPNSVNVIFSISTIILISPEMENNSTPELLSYPVDKAARGHIFIHNPVAYDADGDSISYELGICRGENGLPLDRYTIPDASNQPIYVDPDGNLVWNSPVDTGKYNIALDIIEWRGGLRIGRILRDMQIEVFNTENMPPINETMSDYCVVAGDTISFTVSSTDADLDYMSQEFIGGPFMQTNPPDIDTITDEQGLITSRFTWITNCDHVKRLPHNLVLKTTDKNDDITLVDIDNFKVQVVGPPPENLESEASNLEIILSWTPQSCSNIIGYNIYRKIDTSNYQPDSCETGVSEESGYEFVDFTEGANTNQYVDNNKNKGLAQGIEYCYVITGLYSDGAESIISNETCNILLPGSPSLMNADVTNINETSGSVYISWIRPRNLDTIPANGPYEVIIYRSDDLKGNNLQQIYSFVSTDLNDTTYNDINLNTIQYPYSYSVEIYNNEPGNRFLIGDPEIASTLYPDIVSGDNELTLNFTKNTPWLNDQYIIYRSSSINETFDSIGFTNQDFYIDQGLNNGTEYCYRIVSRGWRVIDSMIFENTNSSHIACGTPIDTFPPCPPVLDVHTICDSLTNQLVWNNLNNSCANDVVRYRIFYSNNIDGELEEIAVINDPEDTVFYHYPELGPAGCYAISAVDSFENESDQSLKVCVDECSGYSLPNIFTPGDPNHEIYYSVNPNNYVKKVNMKIFNRWGMLVYETDNPNIEWDGKYYKNNKMVSTGVYYYVCEVYENRLIGTVVSNLVGFIHVYTEKTIGTMPLN